VTGRRPSAEPELASVISAIQRGDESAFAALAGQYRRELHVHCYRMVGSLEEAEDLVQDTLLRAWRSRTRFEGRSTFRAWMYRIATNACLDHLERRKLAPRLLPRDVVVASDPHAEPPPPSDRPWLDPYPARLLETLATDDENPETALVRKETIELSVLAAIQHLPPRRRAVLILRDVLGWTAKESADALEMTVASVNSTLQRARRALRKQLPDERLDWTTAPSTTSDDRALLNRYMDVHERGDADGLARLLRDDACISAPPRPLWYDGRDAIVGATRRLATDGRFKYVATGANGQLAAASYLRTGDDPTYRPMGIDVLRVEDGLIAEIVVFLRPDLFTAFGLPTEL
jgi:RNA polymerase sigma-70 factor (ECF subfamily)